MFLESRLAVDCCCCASAKGNTGGNSRVYVTERWDFKLDGEINVNRPMFYIRPNLMSDRLRSAFLTSAQSCLRTHCPRTAA